MEKQNPYNLDPVKIEKKLRLSFELYEFAYLVKKEVLSKKHPEWSNDELHSKVIELIHRGCK